MSAAVNTHFLEQVTEAAEESQDVWVLEISQKLVSETALLNWVTQGINVPQADRSCCVRENRTEFIVWTFSFLAYRTSRILKKN
jgi:hypothetical protein